MLKKIKVLRREIKLKNIQQVSSGAASKLILVNYNCLLLPKRDISRACVLLYYKVIFILIEDALDD